MVDLPNRVEAYPDLLKQANLMESKNFRMCLLILNHCVKLIEEHSSEFLEKFPTRKADEKTLKKRIGRVEESIRLEIEKMQKHVCDEDIKKEIDQIRNEALAGLEKGNLLYALAKFDQICTLITQYCGR
jgi:hypothetical protein